MSLPAAEGDFVAQFLDAMHSCGVQMDLSGGPGGQHPIADGKIHRATSLLHKNKKNLHIWYVLYPDTPCSGAFGDYGQGINETWTLKRQETLTAAEREVLRLRMQAAAAEKAAYRARIADEAKAAAKRIMETARKADPKHAYLERKGLAPFPGLRQLYADVSYTIDGERKVARAGWLVVPMYSAQGELSGIQTIRTDGTKSFVKGTIKAGRYHSIGKPTPRIIVGEGYSTCARVHAATGDLCIVAFDSGNLLPVAQEIAKKYPDARIVIAADNDRFTTDGKVKNPGLVKAKEAALAVRGLVAVPHFADDEDKRTDFDDLAQLVGLDPVRQAIEAAVPPKDAREFPERQPAPAPPQAGKVAELRRSPEIDERSPPPADRAPEGDDGAPPVDGGADNEWRKQLAAFGSPHFRCLGIDGTVCYYQPANVSQVIDLPASAHKAENLMRLAPLQWWEMEFPGKAKDGGVNWRAAVNAMMQACMARRKFVPHNAVRGRGAWFEGAQPVFHAGDHLIVKNERVDIADHESTRHVYDEGDALDVDVTKPATIDEARAFLELCKSLKWSSPLSGYLLAGWCVAAPVCGFLSWRPHIWVNGPAGSGKSTVIRDIVKRCLGPTAINVVGMTSEAGIRAALGMDALPVVFDEAEPKDMASQARIRSILDLARVAASESDGLILKGTSNQKTKGFRARSMFAFASINTQIEGYADETRFTQLTLQAPEAHTPEQIEANKQHYEKFVSDLFRIITPNFPRRLLARTIINLPTLRNYVEVFTKAAAMHLGAQRLGDQIGPMLAGAYLLNTDKELTVDRALEWIRGNDWVDHSAKQAARDVDRFMHHLTGHMVRNQTPEGGTWERPIGELIDLCTQGDSIQDIDEGGEERLVPNRGKVAASKALGRLGLRVWANSDGWWVDVSTTGEIIKQRVLRGTPWAGTNLRQLLLSIEGVMPGRGNRYFAPGLNTPYVSLPLELMVSGSELR